MRLRVLLEPRYGATYGQILALARATEEAGFDAFFRSDHFLGIEPNEPALRPTDSWTTLAGLAIQTSRVTLGTLMTAGTFRQPGQLAVEVATVDAMSGGRVELGVGTGWYEREHHAFGIPFPPVGERFDRLEEALSVITGLWSTPPGGRFSFTGKHFQLDECANFPATARDLAGTPGPRRGPRIIIGGGGPRRTPALAARFADEFNTGLGLGAGLPERFAYFRRVVAEPAGTRPAYGCPPRSRCAAPPPGARPSGARNSSARRARGCWAWAWSACPATCWAGSSSSPRPASTPCTSTSTTWTTSTRCGCWARRCCRRPARYHDPAEAMPCAGCSG